MLNLLKDWQGAVEINGTLYDSIKNVNIADFNGFKGNIHIILHSGRKTAEKPENLTNKQLYKITVKQYMTRKASPEFDFMAKWNNDNPMPLRTMTGEKIKETKGMVYMKLKGKAEATCTCMRCGKQLTNPISQYYGIGPECMSKLGIVADISDIDTITKKLVDVEWTGWVIKSAILEEEEL